MKLKRYGFILGLSVFFLCSFPFLNYIEALADERIYFSEQQHFYDHSLQVELKERPNSSIYYTLDGSTPSAKSILYTAPIEISLPEKGARTVTVRAIALRPDGSVSPEHIHTYFVGKDVFERYHSLITVLTADPSDLYDYDTGILVSGRLRDEWLAENPDRLVKASRPANYNIRGIESERPAFLEVFTPDGNRVVAQNVGMRVTGGFSRANDYKSIKVYARSEYGTKKLYYEFFPNSLTASGNQPVSEYKHLILRNNSTIQNVAMIELLKDVEPLEVQEYRLCCGYLNGAYYQTGWLMEDYDNSYFHTNYGTREEEGSWEVVDDYNEAMLEEQPADTIYETITEGYAAADKAYIDSFVNKDFLDNAVFQEFSQLVDVENMLYYFAAEIYLGNADWPYNNIKMYRWYSNTGTYTSDAHTDGKWRYLLYDLDWGFSYGQDFELLAHVLDRDNAQGRLHPVFYNLMRRNDMRERFKEIMQELIATVFETEHACQVINESFLASETELLMAMNTETTADIAFLQQQLQDLRSQKDKMLEFAKERPAIIMRQIEEQLFS